MFSGASALKNPAVSTRPALISKKRQDEDASIKYKDDRANPGDGGSGAATSSKRRRF